MYLVNVNDDIQNRIVIGRLGENLATRVSFNIAEWISIFGEGMVSLLVKRPSDNEPYPVDLNVQNDLALWTVQSSDVSEIGIGQAELVYSVGETVVKSKIYALEIQKALEGSADIPEPYENYVQTIIRYGSMAKESSQAAEISENNAKQSEESVEQTKAQIDKTASAIESAREEIDGKTGSLTERIKSVEDELPNKQDRLTAGENITIEGNVISAKGGDSKTLITVDVNSTPSNPELIPSYKDKDGNTLTFDEVFALADNGIRINIPLMSYDPQMYTALQSNQVVTTSWDTTWGEGKSIWCIFEMWRRDLHHTDGAMNEDSADLVRYCKIQFTPTGMKVYYSEECKPIYVDSMEEDYDFPTYVSAYAVKEYVDTKVSDINLALSNKLQRVVLYLSKEVGSDYALRDKDGEDVTFTDLYNLVKDESNYVVVLMGNSKLRPQYVSTSEIHCDGEDRDSQGTIFLRMVMTSSVLYYTSSRLADKDDITVTNTRIAELEQTKADKSELTQLSAEVEKKADTDGNYPNMTVGLADNLITSDGLTDQSSYIIRQTSGDLKVGNTRAKIRTIKGNTLVIGSSSLYNVDATVIRSTGFNQWDEEWVDGYYDSRGMLVEITGFIASKNHISVIPNTTYTLYSGIGRIGHICFFDKRGNFISRNTYDDMTGNTKLYTFTTDENTYFITFSRTNSSTVTTYKNDICLNISNSRDGEYEPYWSSVRELPPIKELKDADGKLLFPYGLLSVGNVYDEITPTKAIKRVGAIRLDEVDFTVGTDVKVGGVSYHRFNSTNVENIKTPSATNIPNVIATNLTPIPYMPNTNIVDYGLALNSSKIRLTFTSKSTLGDLKPFIQSNYLYYELKTPIEVEFDTPYNLTYEVREYGTEEFVSPSLSSASVPNETFYMENVIERIRKSPTDVQIDGTSIVTNSVAEIPKATNEVSGVVKTAYWGVRTNSSNQLYVDGATESEIDARTNAYKPIVSTKLDYAVKKALTDGKGQAYTEAEQKSARERLGITDGGGTKKYELIEEITTTSDNYTYHKDVEPDGTPYNFEAIKIMIEIKLSSSSSAIKLLVNGVQLCNASGAVSSGGYVLLIADASKGILDAECYLSNSSNLTSSTRYTTYEGKTTLADSISNFEIQLSNGKLQTGTKIKIFGIRA